MIAGEEGRQRLADQAEAEIAAAFSLSVASGHAPEARAALWQVFRGWLHHPHLLQEDGSLRCAVHNQLIFRTSIPQLQEEAFAIIRELALEYHPTVDPRMCEALVIDIFECCAELPEYPESLRFLHSLAADPATRWATFEAYRLCPWWLPIHAGKYSAGNITPADCAEWFRRRFPWNSDAHRIVIDWSQINDEAALLESLASQCGFPAEQERTLDALEDAWEESAADTHGPPYIFEFRNPHECPSAMERLIGRMDSIAKDCWVKHGDALRGGFFPDEGQEIVWA